MHPILRTLVYLALLFFIIFIGVKPYNWVCKISGKCNEIIFENLIPRKEGNRQISILMEVMNQREDIEFEVVEPKLIHTVSGRKNSATYRVKNLTDHTIKFRPKFSIYPKEMSKYISRQECLCFREHKLKKGEEIILPTYFRFKSAIDEQNLDQKNLMIRLVYSEEKN